MDNQHRQITGYRELSQIEIDLMNRIKAHAIETQMLVAAVRDHVHRQYLATRVAEMEGADQDPFAVPTGEQLTELDRLNAARPGHWTNRAEDHMQEGFMALTRAVAQPTTF